MAVELGQANYEASLSLQVNLDPPPVETFLSLDQAQEIMHHVDPAYYTVIQDIGLQKWAANCFQGRIPNSPSVRYIPTTPENMPKYGNDRKTHAWAAYYPRFLMRDVILYAADDTPITEADWREVLLVQHKSIQDVLHEQTHTRQKLWWPSLYEMPHVMAIMEAQAYQVADLYRTTPRRKSLQTHLTDSPEDHGYGLPEVQVDAAIFILSRLRAVGFSENQIARMTGREGLYWDSHSRSYPRLEAAVEGRMRQLGLNQSDLLRLDIERLQTWEQIKQSAKHTVERELKQIILSE